MLALTCERARLANGERFLELCCGRGSQSLPMAANYPDAGIKAGANSRTRKERTDGEARRRGLGNLGMLTCDVNRLELPGGSFNRAAGAHRFLDGATLLHGRHHARRRPAVVFPTRPAHRVALAGAPLAPLADQRGLIATWTATGPNSCRCWPAPAVPPRRAAGGYWRVFCMSCARIVGLCRRPRMAGVALPRRETLSLNVVQKR